MLLSKRSRNERLSFETEYQRIEQEKREQIAAERRKTVFSQPASELAPFELKNEMSPLDYRQYVDHIASTVIDQLRAEGLTDADLTQLDRLLTAQKQLDFSDPKVWKVAISLLTDLGLIKQTVAAPAAAQVVDELSNIDAELDKLQQDRTPEARRRVAELRQELFGLEMCQTGIFPQFVAHCRDTFGIEFPPSEQRECTDWLQRNDKLMSASTLNEWRRKKGWLSAGEILALQIENDPRPTTDYSFQRDAKLAQHALKK